MASFNAFQIPGQTLHERNLEALAKLDSMGVKYRKGFYSTGMPHIHFVDVTKPRGQAVDTVAFAKRLQLGNGLLTSGMSPFNADGLHITLVRWGRGAEECGKLVVDEGVCLSECSIVSFKEVRIEKGVLFGPGVFMFDCDGSPADPQGPRDTIANLEMGPVVIEHDAWIGANVIIMPGVRIGHHATVGSGSVVFKDVPPHTLVAGNPAVVAATFT